MPTSIWSPAVEAAFAAASAPGRRRVRVGPRTVSLPTPFPSPADWRDHWIYFLLVDRFDNPAGPPRDAPWDGQHGRFQGGTFEGVRRRLDYLADLGVGAIWLSPVLKNCQFSDSTYHGYGFHDFLQVEPRFSSNPARARANPAFAEAELRRLVDQAHARGLYVIFDVVLNHTGDVFAYQGHGAEAPWSPAAYTVNWRDERGEARADWTEAPARPPADAAVWPDELRQNRFFRRQGLGGELGGDFASLKELVTAFGEVRAALIRAYQYAIAKFDLDGFRIDTLKYVEPDFARIFGNAVREYALSIGKRNFFTFGEVYDDEAKIAGFIGRRASEAGDLIGVDAALDFPLFFKLPAVLKGLGGAVPADIAALFEHRKRVQRDILSTHGEASRFFVTFLDNHDQHSRFHFSPPDDPARFDHQTSLALGCLFSLQGIPALYYGTEQGLHGSGGSDLAVREALWGKPAAFDRQHRFYRIVQRLSAVRAGQPALRYGRQYFRPISGDGAGFGLSRFPAGMLAFSRILNETEVLVVANTSTQQGWQGHVLVDRSLNPAGAAWRALFSNLERPASPGPVVDRPDGTVRVEQDDGSLAGGPIRTIRVALRPSEIQVLARSA
jgi:glycosidase